MSPNDLRSGIIAVLNGHGQVSRDADLTCYFSEGLFCVDYIYTEETAELLHLTDSERKLVHEDDELIEYFENPEEAADFYLRLTGGRLMEQPPEKHGKCVKQESE
jgi:hypothetical protein